MEENLSRCKCTVLIGNLSRCKCTHRLHINHGGGLSIKQIYNGNLSVNTAGSENCVNHSIATEPPIAMLIIAFIYCSNCTGYDVTNDHVQYYSVHIFDLPISVYLDIFWCAICITKKIK